MRALALRRPDCAKICWPAIRRPIGVFGCAENLAAAPAEEHDLLLKQTVLQVVGDRHVLYLILYQDW